MRSVKIQTDPLSFYKVNPEKNSVKNANNNANNSTNCLLKKIEKPIICIEASCNELLPFNAIVSHIRDNHVNLFLEVNCYSHIKLLYNFIKTTKILF